MKLQDPFRIILAAILLMLVSSCATTPSGPAALTGTWTNSLGTVWTLNEPKIKPRSFGEFFWYGSDELWVQFRPNCSAIHGHIIISGFLSRVLFHQRERVTVKTTKTVFSSAIIQTDLFSQLEESTPTSASDVSAVSVESSSVNRRPPVNRRQQHGLPVNRPQHRLLQ